MTGRIEYRTAKGFCIELDAPLSALTKLAVALPALRRSIRGECERVRHAGHRQAGRLNLTPGTISAPSAFDPSAFYEDRNPPESLKSPDCHIGHHPDCRASSCPCPCHGWWNNGGVAPA
jgi:hypothetical protein